MRKFFKEHICKWLGISNYPDNIQRIFRRTTDLRHEVTRLSEDVKNLKYESKMRDMERLLKEKGIDINQIKSSEELMDYMKTYEKNKRENPSE